jgi:hypothetical protein
MTNGDKGGLMNMGAPCSHCLPLAHVTVRRHSMGIALFNTAPTVHKGVILNCVASNCTDMNAVQLVEALTT